MTRGSVGGAVVLPEQNTGLPHAALDLHKLEPFPKSALPSNHNELPRLFLSCDAGLPTVSTNMSFPSYLLPVAEITTCNTHTLKEKYLRTPQEYCVIFLRKVTWER